MNKHFCKINKKKVYKIIIILVILSISTKQTDFFKKSYFTLTRSYDYRLVNSYEFCGSESIGFLDYIKTSFNINYKVPIINFMDSANSSWYFANLKRNNNNKIIFLNYNKNTNSLKDLEAYKVIYKHNDCYYLEKK
jgi:hypothetical protein